MKNNALELPLKGVPKFLFTNNDTSPNKTGHFGFVQNEN